MPDCLLFCIQMWGNQWLLIQTHLTFFFQPPFSIQGYVILSLKTEDQFQRSLLFYAVPRGNFYFLIYIFSIFLQWIGIIVVMKQTDKIVISFLWCQIPSLAVNFVRHSTTNGMHVDSVLSRSLADTHNDHTRLPDAPLHQTEYLLSTAPKAATASLAKLWEKTSLPSHGVKMIHSSF